MKKKCEYCAGESDCIAKGFALKPCDYWRKVGKDAELLRLRRQLRAVRKLGAKMERHKTTIIMVYSVARLIGEAIRQAGRARKGRKE